MIYLDYNATTPLDPAVAQAMNSVLTSRFGNPSSLHAEGRASRRAIESARGQVARFLGAEESEVIFTSGGTEANNHALIGAAMARREKGRHILVSSVEHPAVTEVCRHLETRGFEFSEVPVDQFGKVTLAAVESGLRPDTILVSIMLANNEVGTLQPVSDIARRVHRDGILMHTDCAQAVGKIPVDFHGLDVDMLSVAGHKFYGPKGVGVLLLKEGLEIPNLMHGAGHEAGRRPGTENILEIVGLGEACRLAEDDLAVELPRLTALRDHMEHSLLQGFPSARVHGHSTERLPNTLSIGFPDLLADEILAALPDVAVSAGAACHGGGPVASKVLRAMAVPDRWALGTLRISTGRMTTRAEVDKAIARITETVNQLYDRGN